MSKTAFLFPGQGAQKPGMGKDFYHTYETAKKIFDQASEKLSLDMPALCFEPNERLDLTEYTQAALATTCLAMEQVAEEHGLRPDVCAGLSLGEYCAISAAGGMSRMDAISVVRQRGILMERAVPAGEGAMAAVLGLEAAAIQEIIGELEGVFIANYNCPGQIVITGRTKAVAAAGEKLKEAGARRVLPLKVSGPFHSPLLLEAGKKLAQVLENTELRDLKLPCLSNVTGEPVTKAGEIRELLVRQISSPVRWQQSVEQMLRGGVDIFVEIGPGKTLSGFVKKISRQARVYSIQTVEDMEQVLLQIER